MVEPLDSMRWRLLDADCELPSLAVGCVDHETDLVQASLGSGDDSTAADPLRSTHPRLLSLIGRRRIVEDDADCSVEGGEVDRRRSVGLPLLEEPKQCT